MMENGTAFAASEAGPIGEVSRNEDMHCIFRHS